MKKLMDRIQTSLLAKVAAITLVFLLIPSLIALIVAGVLHYRSQTQQMLSHNTRLMDLTAQDWGDSLESIVQLPIEVYHADALVQNALRQKDPYSPEQINALQTLLSNLSNRNQEVIGIDITGTNGEIIHQYSFISQFMWQSYAEAWDTEAGFASLPEENPLFGAYRAQLLDYSSDTRLATISIYFSYDRWRELSAVLLNDEPGSSVCLMTENGTQIYADDAVGEMDPELLNVGSGLYRGSMGQQSGYYFVRRMSAYGQNAVLAKFFPSAILLRQAFRSVTPLAIVDILLIVSLGVYMMMLYSGVVKPIRGMATNMEAVQQGVYEYHASAKTSDEIGRMDRQYEHLVHHVDYLINQKMAHELELSKSKLKTLQAQINPHFLNNTLQMVSTSALCEGASETNDLICSLARLLQYNMDVDRDEVSLREEVTHLSHYLKLQQERYENKLHVEILIPEECCGIHLPKMILQPLVENSIKYSRLKHHEDCRILVEARSAESHILLTVSDDGEGMTAEKRQQVRELFDSKTMQVTDSHGIGLLNVLLRLKIYFGEHFSWELRDNEPGLRVILMIPKSDGKVDRS